MTYGATPGFQTRVNLRLQVQLWSYTTPKEFAVRPVTNPGLACCTRATCMATWFAEDEIENARRFVLAYGLEI